jgi:hypothetical protein
LQEAGCLVQVGNIAHFPRAVVVARANQIPTLSRGRYINRSGGGFDITIPSNE